MISLWKQGDRERLAASAVGVAGCGGLGSNCALALARAGVGRLVILDFDHVEEGNLNRQAFTVDQVGQPKTEALAANLQAAAPGCRIEPVNTRYEPGMAERIFGGCAVVVEAFDTPEAKVSLIDDVLESMPETLVVAASGIAGIGGNEALCTRRYGRLYMVGDDVTAAVPGVPLLAPRVMAVASLQANQALSVLLGDLET